MNYDKDLFEVSKAHIEDNEINEIDVMERCSDDDCPKHHMWSVYLRNDTGMVEWLSDHITQDLAELSALVYAPRFEIARLKLSDIPEEE